MRRIPFATFYMDSKPLEIMLTTIDKETDDIILTFELPDPIFGFKTAKIYFNNLIISSREGFTDEEMSEIINIIKTNKKTIKKIAKENIIYA